MIAYICLIFLGVQVGAPWWFYVLIGFDCLLILTKEMLKPSDKDKEDDDE
jgi:hypothetical protein